MSIYICVCVCACWKTYHADPHVHLERTCKTFLGQLGLCFDTCIQPSSSTEVNAWGWVKTCEIAIWSTNIQQNQLF